jgi:MFS family permease
LNQQVTTGHRPGRKIFFGWWIVVAALVLNMYNGGAFTYGFSLFVDPLAETFGWPRSAITGVWSGALMASLLLGPVVGYLIDRFGGRVMVWVGLPIFSLSYILMTRLDNYAIFFVVIVVCMGFGLATGMNAPGEAEVAYWFRRKRALAMGVASAGTGVAGITLVPVIGWLITHRDWQEAALILGVAMAVTALPLGWVMKGRPEEYGEHVDGIPPELAPAVEKTTRVTPRPRQSERAFTAGQAFRTSTFWLLNLAFGLRWLGVAMVSVHQVPYLESLGYSAATAAFFLGLALALSAVTRVLLGWLADRGGVRRWLMIAYLFQGASLVVLLDIRGTWLLYVYAVLFGMGAAALPLSSALVADYFGRRNYATIQGTGRAFGQVGRVLGAMLGGVVYDLTGSYHIAFLSTAIAFFIAVGVLAIARPPERIPEVSDEGNLLSMVVARLRALGTG